MSSLPAILTQQSTRVQDAYTSGDPRRLGTIIDWGYAVIDAEYDPDPVLRPHHAIKRWQARREWLKVINETAKQMRAAMGTAEADRFQYILDRQLDQLKHEDTLQRREDVLRLDSEIRVDEHERMTEISSRYRIKEMKAAGKMASRYALPQIQTDDPVQVVKRVYAEIEKIESDPTLTDEQKHRATQMWREQLPFLMPQAKPK